MYFSTILCISADGLAYIANLPADDEARLPSAGAADGDGTVWSVVEMETVPLGQSGVTIGQVVVEHLPLPPAPSTYHGNGRYNLLCLRHSKNGGRALSVTPVCLCVRACVRPSVSACVRRLSKFGVRSITFETLHRFNSNLV